MTITGTTVVKGVLVLMSVVLLISFFSRVLYSMATKSQ